MIKFSQILGRGRFWLVAKGWIAHDIQERAKEAVDLLYLYTAHGQSEDLLGKLAALEAGVRRNADTIHYFIRALDDSKKAGRDDECTALSSIISDVTLGRPFRTRLSISVVDPPSSSATRDVELSLLRALLLKIALDNLLDNAMRATAKSCSENGDGADRIELSFDIEPDRKLIRIEVRNRGRLDNKWVSGVVTEPPMMPCDDDPTVVPATGIELIMACVKYDKKGSFRITIDKTDGTVVVVIEFPY